MIIEIALGIVLAVLILVFWQPILVLTVFLVVVGIALYILFLIIGLGFAYPEILGPVGFIVFCIWLFWEIKRQEKAKKAKLAEAESSTQAATNQRK